MMDFVKFAHDRNRMCNVKRGAGEGCKGCPLDEIMDKKSVCSVWCFANPEKAIEVVEQWAAEHPVKTRQSEFLEHYPGARRILAHGCLNACPMDVFSDADINCNAQPCFECKKEFWLAEVEE